MTCLVTASLGALGCQGSGATTVDLSVDPLTDVNPTSQTYEQQVHPDDHRGKVSAWYFGHAT